jgi:dihydroorotase
MSATSRREFLTLAGSASAVALSAAGLGVPPALAVMGPNDKFDLVIKGGEVLDPSQNLRAKRDVGIR